MTEIALYHGAVIAMFVMALATCVAVMWIPAPYGRHARQGFGIQIPSKWGWVLMEAPAVLAFIAVYRMGEHAWDTMPLALLCLWQLHYFHRAFVFPFRMRTEGKRMPLMVALMGSAFNCFNGYVNARWISHFGTYAITWLHDPRFWIGVGIFLTGWIINVHADTVLINLRQPGETGYKIPRGGLYRFISCPNYFGEITIWCGWAIATWSWAGLGFALYTISNVGPRAFTHHRWYHEKFSDYPEQRKALIPFVA